MISIFKTKLFIAKLLHHHQTLEWADNDFKEFKGLYFVRFNTRQ